MHADVTGRSVVVCENADAPLLGSAILASVGAGVHGTVDGAVKEMVRTAKRVEPNPENAAVYNNLFEIYIKMSPSARPVAHSIAASKGSSR
jgi:ribulose kinase